MNCEQIRDGLSLYPELNDTDSRKHAMDRHLDECAHCRTELKLWQESFKLIRETGVFELDSERYPVTERVMHRIYQEDPWRVSPLQRNDMVSSPFVARKILIGVAASFLLVIGLFVFSLTEQFAVESEWASKQLIQVTVSSEKTDVTTLPIPETLYDEMLAISVTLLCGLMLLLSWFNRQRG